MVLQTSDMNGVSEQSGECAMRESGLSPSMHLGTTCCWIHSRLLQSVASMTVTDVVVPRSASQPNRVIGVSLQSNYWSLWNNHHRSTNCNRCGAIPSRELWPSQVDDCLWFVVNLSATNLHPTFRYSLPLSHAPFPRLFKLFVPLWPLQWVNPRVHFGVAFSNPVRLIRSQWTSIYRGWTPMLWTLSEHTSQRVSECLHLARFVWKHPFRIELFEWLRLELPSVLTVKCYYQIGWIKLSVTLFAQWLALASCEHLLLLYVDWLRLNATHQSANKQTVELYHPLFHQLCVLANNKPGSTLFQACMTRKHALTFWWPCEWKACSLKANQKTS